MSVLLQDPIFQLNVVIWMLRAPAPPPLRSTYTPLLKNAGYELYAIDKKLTATPTVATILSTKFKIQNTSDTQSKPDVIAKHVTLTEPWLVIECKNTLSSSDPHYKRGVRQAQSI